MVRLAAQTRTGPDALDPSRGAKQEEGIPGLDRQVHAPFFDILKEERSKTAPVSKKDQQWLAELTLDLVERLIRDEVSMTADATKAWTAIGTVRGKLGMGSLACNNAIQKATIAHANYVKLNGGTITHQEVSGKAGFTGVKFGERMKVAGFVGNASSEVMHSLGGGSDAIVGQYGWMNTVYHRIPFVSYETKSYGFGNYIVSGVAKAATVDFASGASAPSATAYNAVYPAANNTGVFTTFNCTSEG